MDEKQSEDSASLFQILFHEQFEKDIRKQIPKIYKKNLEGQEELTELIDSFIDVLEENPRDNTLSDSEGWPKKSHEEPWELRKIRFDLPGLTGAVGKGRIIFVVNPDTQVVELLCFYTHKQYEKRPPDKFLRSLLRGALSRD